MATTKKRGLGRNLHALLGSGPAPVTTDTTDMATETISPPPKDEKEAQGSLRYLPIDIIQPGAFQPRQAFDPHALEELAASIRAHGLLQPIVVRASVGGGSYEIIAGERRWRAAQLVGLTEMPALIRDLDNFEMVALALIENIQREDLNPIEEAKALHRLLYEFDLTHQQVAEAVGKSRSSVTNSLRLMGLQEKVRDMLEKREIEMGHARALLSLDASEQVKVAQTIVLKSLSVRDTEKLVQTINMPQRPSLKDALEPSHESTDPNIQRVQNDLSEKLGAAVSLRHARTGKGKIIINYNSVDELEGILEHVLK